MNCKTAVKAAEAVARAEVVPAVTDAFAAIRAKAPNAKIVALGYPHLSSPGFGDNAFITDEAAEVFNPAAPLDGVSFHPTATGYAEGYYPAVIREAVVPVLRD